MCDVLYRHLQVLRGHNGEKVFPICKSVDHLIRRELQKISKAAGVEPYLNPHSLRRRSGTEYERAVHGAGRTLLGKVPANVADFYILPENIAVASGKLRYPAEFDSGPNASITPVRYDPKAHEPIPAPNPSDWTFDGDTFTYKNRRFPLAAESLRVLKLLALAGRAVPWVKVAEIADLNSVGKDDRLLHQRALAATSRLRKELRRLFSLPGTFDPVLCCGRLHDLGWSIAIPPSFEPPELPSVETPMAAVGVIGPEQLQKARLAAGLRQTELARLVGVSRPKGLSLGTWRGAGFCRSCRQVASGTRIILE